MFDIRKMQEHAVYEAVKAESDADTAREIVCGDPETDGGLDDAGWAKSAMRRLERRFDPAAAKRIRMNCQCGYGMEDKLALLRTLITSASSLEEFADSERANAAGLYSSGGELFLHFRSCPCPIAAKVDRFESNTWCLCTTGYSKVLFERAFGCEVDVTLLKSIKTGDDICLMKIVPIALSWKHIFAHRT